MAQRTSDNLPLGYLRAFLTILVVVHHSAMAYNSGLPALGTSMLAQPRWWGAFPVMDLHRWIGFGAIILFNDVFFMSAMFLLSGLFTWRSLRRKGVQSFLRDRFVRLGIPFLFVAAFIAPLCYYPAYLQMRSAYGPDGLGSYWHTLRALGFWPAGPAWFLWVLLAFDCATAAAFALFPVKIEAVGDRLARIDRPALLFVLIIILSMIAYLPLLNRYGPLFAYLKGPFAFQASRMLQYPLYFLLGVLLGMNGIEKSLLRVGGKLSQAWAVWSAAALLICPAIAAGWFEMMAHPFSHLHKAAWAVVFAISCAASTFAVIALFGHFVKRSRRVFDSLRDNAYGIYLVHIAFVTWLQFALLPVALPAIVKGLSVMIAATMLSWGTTIALRKIPAVARVI